MLRTSYIAYKNLFQWFAKNVCSGQKNSDGRRKILSEEENFLQQKKNPHDGRKPLTVIKKLPH